MSKIIQHTFKIPQLELDDEGNLIEMEPIEETYTFTLLHKGIGIYEEMTSEPLMNSLLQFVDIPENEMIKKIMDNKMLLNLASASYVKIEDGKFHNNRATAEEFKKLPVTNCISDINFVVKLVTMAIEVVIGDASKLPKTKTVNGGKVTSKK